MTRVSAPVAISCGEPSGIGPEIAFAAWRELKDEVPLVWIGDPRHLPENAVFEKVNDTAHAASVSSQAFPVLAHEFPDQNTPGVPAHTNAQAVIDVIARAVELVQSGAACALCTAPIHKKALKDGAGFEHPGHTEFLQALGGAESRAVMMLASPEIRVVPATIHIALEDVPKQLTPDLLRQTLEITNTGLKKYFGVAKPRIAVAGLNPHAGEGGAIGQQERDWIADLVTQMQQEGFDLTGPLPADTMFHARARSRYDAAVAMYHDQALIPIKTLDFDRGVNVTLGLPFVRTSPDHGTAFDIAGQGVANPTSMVEALKLAARMAAHSQ
ncbi:MAG: 4-hydroxythreonine-4-phosphate dehydrogenase PdxA [Pseudomonadota bacterium]